MKKILLIIAYCIFSFNVFAAFEVDGIYYSIYSSTNKTVSVAENQYEGVLVIPSSITYNGSVYSVVEISSNAFFDCTNLLSVTVPSSVTFIGENAFRGCSNLNELILEDGEEAIEIFYQYYNGGYVKDSFYGVPVQKLYLGREINGRTSGGRYTGYPFYTATSSLQYLTIGSKVTRINSYCLNVCPNIKEIISLAIMPPTNGIGAPEECKLYVPLDCKNRYSKNSSWNKYTDIIEMSKIIKPSQTPTELAINGKPIRWEYSRDGGMTWVRVDCKQNIYIDENPERGKVLYRILNEDGTYSSILTVTYYDVVPETIVASPTTDTKIVDESVKFTLDVIDDGYTYQWYHNSVAIEGATENSYEIPVIKSADAGTYYCVVTNPVSSVNSTNVELTVNKCSQFISFPEIGTKTYGDADFKLPATTNKGLPIFYQSMDSDVASISGNTVTITGVGETVIVATQAGNADYLEADYVARRLIVTEYAEPEQNKELTISAAGYATLYLPIAVEIPSDVKVYIGETIKGKYVMLKELKDVIPANTGVVVKAAEGTYEFVPSGDVVAPITNNLFNGTNVDTYITPAEDMVAYVLSMVDGEVGMYRAKLNAEGAFLNNANKVYMELNTNMLGVNNEEIDSSISGSQLSKGFCFAFPETTNISGVKLNSPQTDIYYDLQGRKVSHPTRGMYILNGKKVFVK